MSPGHRRERSHDQAGWRPAPERLEALTGFALLTAGLTWFSQIYPPLSRRRALALELKGLADTGFADDLGADPAVVTRVLDARRRGGRGARRLRPAQRGLLLP